MDFQKFIKVTISIFCLFVLFGNGSAQRSSLDNINLRPSFRSTRILLANIAGMSASTENNLRQAKGLQKIQDEINKDVPFPCPTLGWRSSKRPKSVNRLRPGDIDVIGGIGDSLTAGNGAAAANILQVTVENRGVSWSAGGQGNWRKFLTLPNILKEYNPNLIGYALGDALSWQKSSQFNVAEAGAMSHDIPFMTKELIRRIRNDPRVNIRKDWKLITVMIGGNDFCLDICYHQNPEVILENHRRDMLSTLRQLRDNLPRTIVNLVTAPNVFILKNITNKPQQCEITHRFECPCIIGQTFAGESSRFNKIINKWQEMDEELATSSEFSNINDFAIVLQPFIKLNIFPQTVDKKTDLRLMAVDCFHLSQRGNARVANALWNNMMEPVGRKSEHWYTEEYVNFKCPTEENPYIYTAENSRHPNDVKRSVIVKR